MQVGVHPPRSPSMGFGDQPPPVPTSQRPSLGKIKSDAPPPPLPPRKPMPEAQPTPRSSINTIRSISQGIYNIPRPVPQYSNSTLAPPVAPRTPIATPRTHPHITSPTSNGMHPSTQAPPTNAIQRTFSPSQRARMPSPATQRKSANGSTLPYTVISPPMQLKELVEKHHDNFPLHIVVSSGYFGECEQDTFSEGDRLNVHFAKQTTVAVIENAQGNKIKVPLNSALKFSILYNSETNLKKSLEGYSFKSVKDILAQKELPKVVYVNQTSKGSGSSPSHSVTKGELLVIQSVKHGKFGGQSLVCESIQTKQRKRLSESCHGNFTTKPSDTLMYLPEISTYFTLPIQASVFIVQDCGSDIHKFCNGEAVTIVSIEKDRSIIATSVLDEDYTDEQLRLIQGSTTENIEQTMFELSVDLDMLEVEIVKPKSDNDLEKLYDCTKDLIEAFVPSTGSSKRKPTIRRIGTKAEDDDIYQYVRGDEQYNAGIELMASESIYQVPPSQVRPANVTSSSGYDSTTDTESISSALEYDYTITGPRRSLAATRKESPPTPTDSNCSRSSSFRSMQLTVGAANDISPETDDYCHMSSPSPLPGHDMQDVPLYSIFKVNDERIATLQREVKSLRDSYNTVMMQLQESRQTQQAMADVIFDMKKRLDNNNYVDFVPPKSSELAKMTLSEVLELLDKLKLSQYKEVFEQESIDGTLLSDLDEKILEHDLGITTQLHRKKLLLVIKGKYTFTT